jgi:arylsulfatase
VIPEGGAEGVLLAQGGRTGGFSFFVKDQKLHFLYNWLGRDKFWVHSNQAVPEGKVELRYEFEPTGKPDPAQGYGVPARGQLYINRQLVGSVDMPYSFLRMFGTQGLTCGHDGGEPAGPGAYDGEFRFTGTIKHVTVDLSGELIPDTESEMKIAMMRQ